MCKDTTGQIDPKVTGPALNADSVNSPEPSNPPESLSDQLDKIDDGFVCSHDTQMVKEMVKQMVTQMMNQKDRQMRRCPLW